MIVPADLTDDRVVALIQDHLDEMAPTAPEDARHALDLSGLQTPEVHLFTALVDGIPSALGAVAFFGGRQGELKSMRTAAHVRGRGIGRLILNHLIVHAAASGLADLYLETGTHELFAPARAMYRSAGFLPCPPYGHYAANEHSIHMHLALEA